MQTTTSNRIERAGLIFELSNNPQGKPLAKCLIPTPKGKYSPVKVKWFYRFNSEDQRSMRIAQEIREAEARAEQKQKAKEAKREATANFINPYKVGDIFANSWGYEQTNIDFYEVIKVKDHSIVWREIACESVIGSQGFMSDKVVPMPGEFVGDPETKIIRLFVNSKGEATPYIPMKFGCATLTKATDAHYRSWYA